MPARNTGTSSISSTSIHVWASRDRFAKARNAIASGEYREPMI
jgi:hypothetical protein